MINSNDPERSLSALYSIPSDIPRDEWHEVGRGAIAAGVTIDQLDEWSRPAHNYKGTKDVFSSFKNIKPDGRTGAGTLFKIALDYGWNPQQFTLNSKSTSISKQKDTKENIQNNDAVMNLWKRFALPTHLHPYIMKKNAAGVPLENLRVVPKNDLLAILGEKMEGALVVPVVALDGTFSSLQFVVPPETESRLKKRKIGAKLNLPGHEINGFFTVGELVPGATVYIVEGIGQAWACWQATGAAAVVCFGVGNMDKVARALRQQDRDFKLVIVPDVGKEKLAFSIATEVSGRVAPMPQGWDQNNDVNDLAQKEGNDVLEMLLTNAVEPLLEPTPSPKPLLKRLGVADVHSNPSPAPHYIWKDYVPRGVVTLLGAHGGAGKSTIALMLGVCAALGKALFGVPTLECKTLFVSLEDSERVVRHRLAGICRALEVDPQILDGRLIIVDGTQNPELFVFDDRSSPGVTTSTFLTLKEMVKSEGVGLVIIDNASDAFGGDEIQRRQVRGFIRIFGQFEEPENIGVLVLVHVDKNTSRYGKAAGGEGYSGSTAWHNSVRSRLFLIRLEDDTLRLEHQKANLSKMRGPLMLQWLEGGLPQAVQNDANDFDFTVLNESKQDDINAVHLLRMISEFEGRQQFCSPGTTSKNHVHSVLKSDPAFQKLKLNVTSTKRVVTQCQRAKWIEVLEYRDSNRKIRQRWTLTPEGRQIAGLSVPTAPSAPAL